VAAEDVALRVLARHVVDEQVLGDDDIAFHPHHLGDVGNFAGAIAQARGLDHDVEIGRAHV
jgi:hypothetical protein